MGIELRSRMHIRIEIDSREDEAVRIAAMGLAGDLRNVLNAEVIIAPFDALAVSREDHELRIAVGTIDVLEVSDDDLALISDDKGRQRRECYLISERQDNLLILGADRRGAIYGIYSFCEKELGVSPWTFWADVPIAPKDRITLPDGFQRIDYPSIPYRGIFINDEEELEKWVERHMGEQPIGVRTYERIFELLLRLGLNYLWPAMHVASFNMNPENGILADRMGIIIGTSHCDMMMRSNQREWRPWLLSKGYDPENTLYDFSYAGRGRDVICEYWEESVRQNRNLEVSYTLGMRGIHDSGVETGAFAHLSGDDLVRAKAELLENIIGLQEEMIAENVQNTPLKLFIPYKEVLELYNSGMEVPDDLTLMWTNDNYGHVRRYPDEEEKRRPAGNGIYFHNSYWAPSGMSYLFITSIPLSQTRNELKKAYEEGIRKVWVTNFGAVKPLEIELTYYSRLAWEIGREDALSNDEAEFLEKWIDQTFSGNHGKRLSQILTEFDQLTNVRKIEQMDSDVFSQTSYGDEGAARLHRYEYFFKAGNRIYNSLPVQERDAFFQLVLMKLHAGYYTNAMYYYADRSNLCMRQQKASAASMYSRLSLDFDHARRSLIYYYNHVMSAGKWNGILTPEDFPPPRTALFAACKVPLEHAPERLIVTCQNEADSLTFVKPAAKWFEVANAGETEVTVSVKAPAWLKISDPDQMKLPDEKAGDISVVDVRREYASGITGTEQTLEIMVHGEDRLITEVDWEQIPALLPDDMELPDQRETGGIHEVEISGEIEISCMMTGQTLVVPVRVVLYAGITLFGREHIVFPPHMEDDGMIRIEADMIRDLSGAWIRIPNLGRGRGALVEARSEGAKLIYEITVVSEGSFLMEIHRFPGLNSTGRIRIGVSVDEGEMQVLESESVDEHRGTWRENVRNDVEKMYFRLPAMKSGAHRIIFHGIDRYFAFTRFNIYTKDRLENNLGLRGGDQRLPEKPDMDGFVIDFYGREAANLPPRPVYYAKYASVKDSLDTNEIVIQPVEYGDPVLPKDIVRQGEHPFQEKEGAIRIEAGAALAGSKFANLENGQMGEAWDYCLSPSHGETGLAMYIRTFSQHRLQVKLGSSLISRTGPCLHYIFEAKGGVYEFWARVLLWDVAGSHFTIGLDDHVYSERELYGGQPVWHFSCENIWVWVRLIRDRVRSGRHTLHFFALSAGFRVEQFYITQDGKRPPVA